MITEILRLIMEMEKIGSICVEKGKKMEGVKIFVSR